MCVCVYECVSEICVTKKCRLTIFVPVTLFVHFVNLKELVRRHKGVSNMRKGWIPPSRVPFQLVYRSRRTKVRKKNCVRPRGWGQTGENMFPGNSVRGVRGVSSGRRGNMEPVKTTSIVYLNHSNFQKNSVL